MPQRYRVRLGDGAFLSVDLDGLRARVNDDRARAQVVGTPHWRPLGELIAEEESAARLARALVPPKPRAEAPTDPPVVAAAPHDPPPPAELSPAPSTSGLQVLADDLAPIPSARRTGTRAPQADLPIIPMKPLDDTPAVPYGRDWDDGPPADEAPRHARLEGPLLDALTVLASFLSRCLAPLTPLAKVPPAARAATERPEGPSRRDAPHAARAAAPTPVSELPVLRFAATHEAPEVADVYAGDSPSLVGPAVWSWVKRIAGVGVVAVLGVLSLRERDAWLPRVARVAQTAFTEGNRLLLSRERAREQGAVLARIGPDLPQLRPQTIRLVLARDSTGHVEAPEVFRRARDAADHGRAALALEEATELATLERELLGTLGRGERDLVRDYDRARASRVLFPFESPRVMEIVARGARALPAERLERLQELLDRAVTAGLDASGVGATEAAADRPNLSDR